MCGSLCNTSLMENLSGKQLVNFQILAEQFIKDNISKMKGMIQYGYTKPLQGSKLYVLILS